MPQNQLNPILSAIRTLFSRLYGTLTDLTDLSRIVLMSQLLYGYTHELVMDLTHDHALIMETIEDIPIDEGYLTDPVTWLNEADEDEMRRPSQLAVKTCYILANE